MAEITASMVKELREKTGAGMMEAKKALEATQGDMDKAVARLKELLYLETVSPPHHFGNRYFYTRRHKDKEKAILYWKEGENGAEKVLIATGRKPCTGTLGFTELGGTVDSRGFIVVDSHWQTSIAGIVVTAMVSTFRWQSLQVAPAFSM